MNLDQLALQCYEECGDYHLGSVSQFNHKKFAELIVGECIRYFNEDYQRDFDVLWREDLTKGMKKHFGVE